MTAGKDDGLVPCGLAARDSLRAGAVLPLSHQDVGDWPFAENPWPFALCDKDDKGNFTKDFFGAGALQDHTPNEFTQPFAGYDPRKMNVSEKSFVADENGDNIGTILTCATDMAIGRVDDMIVSLATSVSDGRPEKFTPRGLSCGFVKLSKKKNVGDLVYLTDGKRKIKVEIRSDVRPDRTARHPMKDMV